MFLRFTRVRRGSAVLEYASIAERMVEDHRQKTITVYFPGIVHPFIYVYEVNV